MHAIRLRSRTHEHHASIDHRSRAHVGIIVSERNARQFIYTRSIRTVVLPVCMVSGLLRRFPRRLYMPVVSSAYFTADQTDDICFDKKTDGVPRTGSIVRRHTAA